MGLGPAVSLFRLLVQKLALSDGMRELEYRKILYAVLDFD